MNSDFFAKADTDCTELVFHFVYCGCYINSNAFPYSNLKSEIEILADYCCLIIRTLPLHKTFHFSLDIVSAPTECFIKKRYRVKKPRL
jgi:hypothetical protein